MKTLYDVQQLLKRFGTIIYTGDRLADIEMMQDEITLLFKEKLIEVQDYQTAMLVLKREYRKSSY
ncbi:YqgQ family protein [Fictibacillus sp. Mic-4]|uniref:YqgQ family protein n=1 Tax=Fictibacillus TaxID=1329200 RepID=UPI0003F58AD3|nr:YqgQ family protein [Fictibacillus gelatini]